MSVRWPSGRRGAALLLCAAATGALLACAGPSASPTSQALRAREALVRARSFLDSLRPSMDPLALRRVHVMRGKKYFAEYLSAYEVLYRHGGGTEREAIRRWLSPLERLTRTEAYHELGPPGSLLFRQDAISYLNAARLLERLGFDTREYRERIRGRLPAILHPAHLATRGIDNLMAITYQLEALGFDGGPDLCELYRREASVVRTHPDLAALDLSDEGQRRRAYDLTHEVFFLTGHGSTPLRCADDEDLAYLRRVHAELLPLAIELENPDLVAELVMDLNYLASTDLPGYGPAIDYLLASQNPDGSWFHRAYVEHVRSVMRPGYKIEVGQYLHTTSVAMMALSGVIDRAGLYFGPDEAAGRTTR